MCNMRSRADQSSAFTPGRSRCSGSPRYRSAFSSSQPSASPRNSSSRRPTGPLLRDELERHIADHDLVAAMSARRVELALHALADQTSLQALDLDGIFEVGLRDPPP